MKHTHEAQLVGTLIAGIVIGRVTYHLKNWKKMKSIDKQEEIANIVMQNLNWMITQLDAENIDEEAFTREVEERMAFMKIITKI